MRLGWITDPHMNFVNTLDWWRELLKEGDDAYLITGDIAEASSIIPSLQALAAELPAGKMIYFVLGNHDFYGSTMPGRPRATIADTRARVSHFAKYEPKLVYLHGLDPFTSAPKARVPVPVPESRAEGASRLPALERDEIGKGERSLRELETGTGTGGGFVEIAPNTAMVGVDGWYDTLNGNVKTSRCGLADFHLIPDMNCPAKERNALCQTLTMMDAVRLQQMIKNALGDKRVSELVVATHVPPFAGAAWHLGEVSDAEHLPYFSNRLVGKAIVESTEDFRQAGGKVTVLCGHSHSEGKIYPHHNLKVLTGAAEYYAPKKHMTLTLGELVRSENW